ncbi:kinase-like domain-containing protein [Aspergillus varians]
MLLSDFGEARRGKGLHGGDIMPLEYRAPETLLYVGWSFPVDIWSVGLTDKKAWDLLGPKKLFTARDEDGDLYDAAHIAQLIAALGPPPDKFLERNPERRADFWDEKGEWLGLAPIPYARTMEALETKLEDKSGFLRFIRRALTWLPEDRPSAQELLQDPWLECGKEV